MEFLIGLLIGLIQGVFGAGGSIISVPMIVLTLQQPFSDAIGISLGAVALSSLTGLSRVYKEIVWPPTLVLAITGLAVAPFGRWLALSIDELLLMSGFSFIALSIAALMWKQSHQEMLQDQVSVHVYNRQDFLTLFPLLASGVVIGLLCGLFGIGGGIFVIPYLRMVVKMPLQSAIAGSLFSIVIVSTSGFLSHLHLSDAFNIPMFTKICLASIAGTVLGVKINQRLRPSHHQKLFALLLGGITCLTLVWKSV